MHKSFLVTAALLGALSVALGAFGAHGLKQMLSEQSLSVFETAVRYQFYHVFALALTAVLYKEIPVRTVVYAGRLFIAGMVFFSGSLYLLVALPHLRWLGAITPLGGICFITGWIALAAALAKSR
ncbi:DUF423 domain-containing protein [Sediminibacterium soli]|uniref:DUF423 domain-containing protein n=1 Tax=Sediminibacterium soli TaxID=2698829 RepID=UPI00137A1814|nr:DUF423 domain-containing protein [Sediminibacterium soli]NCI46057.1 DUF423 domain-containing protein [Sediminibacterium soli]